MVTALGYGTTGLSAGQTLLVHGVAGAAGSMVAQLAREAGAYVIGTGRAVDREKARDLGAQESVRPNVARGRRSSSFIPEPLMP